MPDKVWIEPLIAAIKTGGLAFLVICVLAWVIYKLMNFIMRLLKDHKELSEQSVMAINNNTTAMNEVVKTTEKTNETIKQVKASVDLLHTVAANINNK